MTTDISNKKGLLENPITLTLISLATFILLLIGIVYIANHFETLEDRLQYREPKVIPPSEGKLVTDPATRKHVYVPVYSHIYASGGTPQPLETTLSIRNVERSKSIRLYSIRYYDSQGKMVKEFFDGVVEIGPLQTSEFLIPAQDHSGGSGANFIISWNAETVVQDPIIEAIMVGQQISFTSQGRILTTETGKTNFH